MKITEALKRGDERARFRFYDEHKSEFLQFAKKYNLGHEDLVEVYQDACLVVFENAVKGKLDQLNSLPKTYLFGVAKFLIYKRFRENEKLGLIQDVADYETHLFDPFEESNLDEKQAQIRRGLQQLGKKCRALLKYFYFEEKDFEEIMERMSYSSKDVLKSQKSRCVKQLKEIIRRDG